MQLKYKRVIIKISGEALMSEKEQPLDFDIVGKVADQLIEIANMGAQIGIIIGGGNIWRGRSGGDMDRVQADHMGMLATVINALALQDALQRKGQPARVLTAIDMPQVAERYVRGRAVKHLEKNRIVIFAGGTGNPFFSTDTGAALRAAEMNVKLLLLAKNVDAVYTADPKIDPNAKRIDNISYIEIIEKGYTLMDYSALTLCMDNGIPIMVFGLGEKDGIKRAVCGEKIGTLIK